MKTILKAKSKIDSSKFSQVFFEKLEDESYSYFVWLKDEMKKEPKLKEKVDEIAGYALATGTLASLLKTDKGDFAAVQFIQKANKDVRDAVEFDHEALDSIWRGMLMTVTEATAEDGEEVSFLPSEAALPYASYESVLGT